MRKVRQRTDDMLIIRGVNVFPSQIEDVLLKVEGVAAALPDRGRPQGRAGRHRGAASRSPRRSSRRRWREMVAFTKEVSDRLHAVLGLHAKVTLVEPGSIERTSGKAQTGRRPAYDRLDDSRSRACEGVTWKTGGSICSRSSAPCRGRGGRGVPRPVRSTCGRSGGRSCGCSGSREAVVAAAKGLERVHRASAGGRGRRARDVRRRIPRARTAARSTTSRRGCASPRTTCTAWRCRSACGRWPRTWSGRARRWPMQAGRVGEAPIARRRPRRARRVSDAASARRRSRSSTNISNRCSTRSAWTTQRYMVEDCTSRPSGGAHARWPMDATAWRPRSPMRLRERSCRGSCSAVVMLRVVLSSYGAYRDEPGRVGGRAGQAEAVRRSRPRRAAKKPAASDAEASPRRRRRSMSKVVDRLGRDVAQGPELAARRPSATSRAGEQLTLVGQVGSWYKVTDAKGVIGWVSAVRQVHEGRQPASRRSGKCRSDRRRGRLLPSARHPRGRERRAGPRVARRHPVPAAGARTCPSEYDVWRVEAVDVDDDENVTVARVVPLGRGSARVARDGGRRPRGDDALASSRARTSRGRRGRSGARSRAS